MLSAAIILSGETEKLFFDSLNTIDGVEWNGIFCSNNDTSRQLNQALIFSSPELIPMISDFLVILDPEFCQFDYLSSAIRNGCHLLLSDQLKLNAEERKQLILLAREGGSYIQVQNNFLFQPLIKKILNRKYSAGYIEIRQTVQCEPCNLKEILLNNLLLILKTTGAPFHKVNFFCGTKPSKQPEVINIHLSFTNGAAASLTLSFTGNHHSHLFQVHHDGDVDSLDLLQSNTGYQFPDSAKPGVLWPAPTLLSVQISDFIKKIGEKSSPVYSLNDDLELYLLFDRIKGKFELHSVTF